MAQPLVEKFPTSILHRTTRHFLKARSFGAITLPRQSISLANDLAIVIVSAKPKLLKLTNPNPASSSPIPVAATPKTMLEVRSAPITNDLMLTDIILRKKLL